jgi:hypothetical protein
LSDTALPDPLVPAEVDLRGLEYMPLLGAKLFASDFYLEANDAEFRRALLLWWAAWNQQPAASLPNSDRGQAKLAGFEDERSATWRKVKARALHGFVLCSDGRLYHPILAKQALIAWELRAEDRVERENDAERQRRTRAERKRMFEQLRAVGVTPKYDVKMDDLRALVTQHVTSPVTVTAQRPVTVTGTVTDTAKTGRDGTGQEERERAAGEAGQLPTPAGAVGMALKRAGLSPMSFQLGNPVFLALLSQGATVEEFESLAAEALAKGIDQPWPWILKVLPQRRSAAEKVSLAPVKKQASAWEGAS